MLGTHSPQDWEVLKAEVLANHGFVFYEEDQDGDESSGEMSFEALQQRYFDQRYWYRRDESFGAARLSVIEQQNLDTVTLALTRQLGRAVSPGMMHLFAKTPLTEQTLAGVSLADLRLRANIALITRREGRLHEVLGLRLLTPDELRGLARDDLHTVVLEHFMTDTARYADVVLPATLRLLTPDELRGLAPEDARRLRNEIFARHGRRFRDRGLQRYFAGFAWYRPNDAFGESQLSDTERRNAELISQYESGKFTGG